MIGAIAGDIIGSVYEFHNIKTTDFPLFSTGCTFTDDTVLTVALADTILHGGSYAARLEDYYYKYPDAGYGGRFHEWARGRDHKPYNSWGNGSAMRVSPVGFAFNDLQTVLLKARESAEVTHNHPEGVKGAQATAAAIFLARTGENKDSIRSYVGTTFGYNLERQLDGIRNSYEFDVSCQGSVPEAIIAFLESSTYEDAVRKAISIGGDSDTIACITGGIAEAYYKGVPSGIVETALSILDDTLRDVVIEFRSKYCMEM
jgi:ADP-ribosylglycohydrolase